MSTSDRKLNELPIPLPVWDDPNAGELLRGWVAHGCLHVSLRSSWDDPAAWGIFLSDVARHAARALANEQGCSEQEALDRIKEGLDAEWLAPSSDTTTSRHDVQ